MGKFRASDKDILAMIGGIEEVQQKYGAGRIFAQQKMNEIEYEKTKAVQDWIAKTNFTKGGLPISAQQQIEMIRGGAVPGDINVMPPRTTGDSGYIPGMVLNPGTGRYELTTRDEQGNLLVPDKGYGLLESNSSKDAAARFRLSMAEKNKKETMERIDKATTLALKNLDYMNEFPVTEEGQMKLADEVTRILKFKEDIKSRKDDSATADVNKKKTRKDILDAGIKVGTIKYSPKLKKDVIYKGNGKWTEYTAPKKKK